MGKDFSSKKIKNETSSKDNYEIFKNILKIDLITYLKKKGVINYRAKVLEIPKYFSVCEEDQNFCNLNLLPVKRSQDNFYENLLNETKFNEGSLIFKGDFVISLPFNYDSQNNMLENFVKNNVYDLHLFKSDSFTMFSDKSSNSNSNSNSNSSQTKISRENVSNTAIQGKKVQEITNYFKLKFLISSILYSDSCKKEDLLIELRRNNYFVPTNFRKFIYAILLDYDYYNELEEFEISSYYENRTVISKEMTQIKKDLERCEEYDFYYKTEEGKHKIKLIFEALIYHKEEFFYTQGMDSICAAFIKLYYPDIEKAYGIFYRFIKKLLFTFYDHQNKTIKSLDFYHLIIKRLLAFLDPELFLYLDGITFFEEQFATNWILTLFSRSFKFEILFKIWDIFVIEELNILYIFICLLLIGNRNYILTNSKETIISDFNEISECTNIDGLINQVMILHKFVPKSLIPLSQEFNEEVFHELKKNEYFKNRWWDFENYYVEKYFVPVITLEDLLKILDKVIFVDLRLQLEYENIRVKDSFHLSITKNKYQESTISSLEKINGNKIVVLIGNQKSDYKDYVNFLLQRKIKNLTILQGGIDIVFVDEPSMVYKK